MTEEHTHVAVYDNGTHRELTAANYRYYLLQEGKAEFKGLKEVVSMDEWNRRKADEECRRRTEEDWKGIYRDRIRTFEGMKRSPFVKKILEAARFELKVLGNGTGDLSGYLYGELLELQQKRRNPDLRERISAELARRDTEKAKATKREAA